MKLLLILTVLFPACLLAMIATHPYSRPRPMANTPYSAARSYPYAGATFDNFVEESFKVAGEGKASDFYNWFDKQLTDKTGQDWTHWIAARTTTARGKEVETATELHRLIKKTITKFSLDRGFEFHYTVSNGERQCFLQSVLIAGILQKIGLDAGVAMVYRNIAGEPSFLGHAVCVLKLSNGHDILVDASEPMASPKHVGLFLYDSDRKRYQFVEPNYSGEQILSYKRADDGSSLTTARAMLLDIPFLESQFDYYRGERAIDGILSQKPSGAGLKKSQEFFERSVQECSNNALAVYMLGRTYVKQERKTDARAEFENSMALCEKFGWVPDGLKSALR